MDDPILNFQKKFLVRFGREFSRVSRRIGLDFSVIVEGNMGVTFSLIITGFFILMQMRMFLNFLLNWFEIFGSYAPFLQHLWPVFGT